MGTEHKSHETDECRNKSTDSIDKFPLYVALRVPEVWRYEGSVEIWGLNESRYVRHPASAAIPVLDEEFIIELMESSEIIERPAWTRQTRQRIHERIGS